MVPGTSTVSGQKASRGPVTATSTPRSSKAAAILLCGVVGVLSSATVRADDDDVVGPLRESIAAAAVIVEGKAEHPYAAWNGTDAATIRTYTPFVVTRVLKGAPLAARILLRQAGGEVAGASAVLRGAEFSEGEEAIVFLGARDAGDGSYDVSGGRRGKFVVQRDELGRPVLEVRLGADASANGRGEKAPGTGLARVPVELFEQLAAGTTTESAADLEQAPAHARSSSAASELDELKQPSAPLKPRAGPSDIRMLLAVALLASLVTGACLTRRRGR